MHPHEPSPAAVLTVENLRAGFQDRVVLNGLSFEVPARGVLAIMGPAGVGKSTLLRTLARLNEPLPSFWVEGRVRLRGRSLLDELSAEEAQRRVALLAQKAKLYTASVLDNAIADIRGTAPLDRAQKRELARTALVPVDMWQELSPLLDRPVLSLGLGQQRRLSIARLAAAGVECLLADEPLRDLSETEAAQLAELLGRLALEVPIIMVTHNRREAQSLSDRVALFVDGKLAEVTPTNIFFTRPSTQLGSDFVRWGNCWPAPIEESEDAPEPADPSAEPAPLESVEQSAAPAAAPEPARRVWVPRPGGFHWILPGQLGGMQRPGLLQPLAEDLEGLQHLGCQVLVNLTHRPPQLEELAALGIESHHVPIQDMSVPGFATADRLCAQISAWVDAGRPTVVHCKAGLGRTGTILACTLVWRGENAVRAVNRVRAVNPAYIQTDDQLAFVSRFAHHLEHAQRPRETA
jgi:atypical dual specificity phosphatase